MASSTPRFQSYEPNFNTTINLWKNETSDNRLIASVQKVSYAVASVFTAIGEAAIYVLESLANVFIWTANVIHACVNREEAKPPIPEELPEVDFTALMIENLPVGIETPVNPVAVPVDPSVGDLFKEVEIETAPVIAYAAEPIAEPVAIKKPVTACTLEFAKESAPTRINRCANFFTAMYQSIPSWQRLFVKV